MKFLDKISEKNYKQKILNKLEWNLQKKLTRNCLEETGKKFIEKIWKSICKKNEKKLGINWIETHHFLNSILESLEIQILNPGFLKLDKNNKRRKFHSI